MKNIYATTDFSSTSESATQFAVSLAQQTGAKITLIHAYYLLTYDSEVYTSLRPGQLEELRNDAEANLQEWAEKNMEGKGIEYDLISKEGFAKDVIVSLTNKGKPDLLVMGTHKKGLIDKVLFGSLTGNVLAEVTPPLLVIPEGFDYQPFTRAAFAADFHDNDIESIKKMIEIIKPMNGHIDIIHVLNDMDKNSKYEASYFEDFKKELLSEVSYEKVGFELIHAEELVETLNKYVDRHQINLLGMSQTNKNWFIRLFTASITREQFYKITVPTLFFKAKDEQFNVLF